jgi:DNA-binding response OmpR family regulator
MDEYGAHQHSEAPPSRQGSHSPKLQPMRVPNPPTLDRAQHSVLVVDDNEAALYAIARQLRAGGFNVVEASGGAKALELVDFVSALVLDVHLPDLLGFEVCRLVRERPATSNLPVICVSAMYKSEQDQVHGIQTGADAYMPAPIDPDALLAALDHLIAARATPLAH